MNREVIKQFSKEFIAWFEYKNSLLYRPINSIESSWKKINIDDDENQFLFKSGYEYIIDDELVEIRKAKADGKTIEYSVNGSDWEEYDKDHNILIYDIPGNKIKYRIVKTIRIGSFVRFDTDTKEKIGIIVNEDNNNNSVLIKSFGSILSRLKNSVELWEPKENEIVIEFSDTRPTRITRYSCIGNKIEKSTNTRWEPYLGHEITLSKM